MPTTQNRKLSAILFADIVGYTALMQTNEQKALSALQKFKTQLETQIPTHQGEIIQFYGDGCLCVFNSSVEAVTCANNLQIAFQSKPKVPVRIGLHAGDVVFKDDNVFGDAVNITSRIESMGIPGSVLLSSNVRNQIKNKPEFKLVALGKFEFKNVVEGMTVYALGNEGLAVPKQGEIKGKGKAIGKRRKFLIPILGLLILGLVMALFLLKLGFNKENVESPNSNMETSQQNSIAILPFIDLSPNQNQEHYCYGIMEEINYRLNQIEAIDRIAPRTAVLPFKNSEQPIAEIANALKVDYLVEGSFRKENQDVIISINIIDAKSQNSIFQKRYPRKWKDIFAVQANIASDISTNLNIVLNQEEKQKITLEPTENMEAYTFFLKGDLAAKENNNEKAFTYFQKAIEIDTNYVEALYRMATTLHAQATIFGSKTTTEVYPTCLYYLNKAIQKSGGRADIVGFRSTLKMFSNLDFREISNLFKQIDTDNYFHTHLMFAFCVGKYEFLIGQCKKELEKDPLYSWYYTLLTYSQYKLGKKTEAFKTIKKAVNLFPEDIEIREILGKLYLYEKDYPAAIQHLEEALKMALNSSGIEVLQQRIKTHLAIANWKKGDHKTSSNLFNEIVNFQTQFTKPLDYTIAQYYAGINKEAKAKEWLEKAYNIRDVETIWIYTDPLMEKYADKKFYQNLLEKMGIAEILVIEKEKE